MEKMILSVIVGSLVSLSVFAGAPTVIEVTGSIYKASNVNGHCGASTFGYIVEGTYKDLFGKEQTVFACLESIAVPLVGSIDVGLSKNLMTDAKKVLSKAAGKSAKMVFAVTDSYELNYGLGTLISIAVETK
jgi:hypothetical protein